MKRLLLIACLSGILFTSCDKTDTGYLDTINAIPIKPSTPPSKPKPDEPKPDESGPEITLTIPEAQKDYYKTIDWKATGLTLKDDLASLVSITHTKALTYGEVWDASKATDLTPAENEVYLIYGHKGENSGIYAYTRGRNKNGGDQAKGNWNREHVYAKSLGKPNLGTTGPGADAHHLRPADIKLNSIRSNDKFAKGSGESKPVAGGFYPGDEWKGDVARMMMYMYLRYGEQCLPSNVAVGQTNSIDKNMINLLLEWNAQDPVSAIERKRNEYHGNKSNAVAQGNRNPFIDNPYIANLIWGTQSDKALNAANIWQ